MSQRPRSPFSIRDQHEGHSISREVLDRSEDVCCLLDGILNITYCSPRWDTFAMANHGEKALSANVLNTRIFNYIPAELRAFYVEAFALAKTGIVEFDYECSSAQLHRLFRMQIMPIKPEGYALIHSIRVEEPISAIRTAEIPGGAHLADDGSVAMCVHCRCTRRRDEPSIWDWVPSFIRTPPVLVSHALCPICEEYFYSGR